MLKALELAGFKSFADRTRFAFPPGITVVVGPNGSGKSNVVDSIKWVLGEQSIRSLRGREMADVIFNGSGGRRAVNTAEVTLTFDNSQHLLAIDAPEVEITRRVYRSGEGEYLINRNPARLRDIRDLLSGTGMGTQAYSVIEQGKVDVLLQSSARERRVILEEAAGISRFKLRKLEALRRLERVEQNLLRLSDIVDEVQGRLTAVRAQAGKARRYRDYANRLQELRTQAGLVDWRRLSRQLAGLDGELQTLRDQCQAAAAEVESHEARRLDIDQQVGDFNERIRQAELQAAAHRERIAAGESTIQHHRSRSRDLEHELERHRRQLAAMSARASHAQQQLQATTTALNAGEEKHGQITQRLLEAERSLADTLAAVEKLRGQLEQGRAAHVEQTRRAAALENETRTLQGQVNTAAAACQRGANRLAELDRMLQELQTDLAQLRRRRSDLNDDFDRRASLLAAAQEQLGRLHQQHAAAQAALSELRQRQSGLVERAAVLQELIQRHEGLSAGVKEVLTRAANPADPVFRDICGLVADVFHVSVEVAPLVEIALGQAAQHVVAPRSELITRLLAEAGRLSGRVGFVWLDAPANDLATRRPSTAEATLEGQPGVLGRADQFVETQVRFVALAHRLLGRTWFVERLSQAIELARSAGRGLSFVTLSGELLEPDGTLTVGPRTAGSGLISRRSQLRGLLAEREQIAAAIAEAEQAWAQIARQVDAQQQLVAQRTAEQQRLADALADNRVTVSASEERRSQLDGQRTQLDGEAQAAAAQHAAAVNQLAATARKRQELDGVVREMESHLAQLAEGMESLEQRRLAGDRESTEIKVELAKCEEQLRNLHVRQRQCEESRQERDRAIAEARGQLSDCGRRADVSRWSILQTESEIAELYLGLETFAAQIVGLIQQRESLQAQRSSLVSEIQKVSIRARRLEEKLHAVELSANEVRHDRDNLANRMREDYHIELAGLDRQSDGQPPCERESVQQEIEDLRHKLNNLGNVNLESLAELEQLETRHQSLASQYQDLVAAKSSLEKIIDQINTDSRRLFSEVFETVRGHFQTLFRDLFGGGQADIILEENVDILDSGIEIVARPPGKEPRSISLLSGGEKTLTCVALLLAIFRSRPSPFCVLDEVDAALDEANIDRFTQVLRGFLTWTQFIIITHSKKTMTCANTIYGVTMQESGVSKQVSVRFEDVSDDGQIRPEAITDPQRTQAA